MIMISTTNVTFIQHNHRCSSLRPLFWHNCLFFHNLITENKKGKYLHGVQYWHGSRYLATIALFQPVSSVSSSCWFYSELQNDEQQFVRKFFHYKAWRDYFFVTFVSKCP